MADPVIQLNTTQRRQSFAARAGDDLVLHPLVGTHYPPVRSHRLESMSSPRVSVGSPDKRGGREQRLLVRAIQTHCVSPQARDVLALGMGCGARFRTELPRPRFDRCVDANFAATSSRGFDTCLASKQNCDSCDLWHLFSGRSVRETTTDTTTTKATTGRIGVDKPPRAVCLLVCLRDTVGASSK